MAKPTTPTTYRFDSPTLELIERLASDLSLSKADVIRSSVQTLNALLVVASADANATLAVLRERHPDAKELTIDIVMGRDGSPEPTVLIDGEEHADVGARTALIGNTAFAFLTIVDGSASLPVGVGNEALLIRPQFAAGGVEWPSAQSHRIVIDLRVPAAARASVSAKAEV